MDLLGSNQPPQQPQQDALVLATFFHDAIYNVHSGTNEEDSAVLFQQFVQELREGGVAIARDLEDTVVQMILATQKHQVSSEHDPLLALFLDLDMAVLGKEATAYDQYAQLIRREYQHVPHDTYCEKRAEILEEFLKQPQIYGTETLLVALEQRARDNLQREIECLRRGEIPGGGNGHDELARVLH
jgi:predicted metal-dependent HD superfamily phosphohydrolase